MNFTKDQIILLNHALDVMCRTEAQGAVQGGLAALKQNNAATYIGGRITEAVVLSGALDAEYLRIVEEERVAAEAAAAAEVAKLAKIAAMTADAETRN